MHFICVACGTRLTRECSLVSDVYYQVDAGDGKASVPESFVVSLNGGFYANPVDINPNVLVSAGEDYGCCGSDGLDGPNRACICGAIVATERSDCWTCAEIHFIATAVVLCGN